MAEFKYFRHTLTGKVGSYPAEFGDLFPDFVEVDSNAADCIDCRLKDEDVDQGDYIQDEDEDFPEARLDPIDDDDFPDPVVAHDDKDK